MMIFFSEGKEGLNPPTPPPLGSATVLIIIIEIYDIIILLGACMPHVHDISCIELILNCIEKNKKKSFYLIDCQMIKLSY